MLVRSPEKKPPSSFESRSSFSTKVANDNLPPPRMIMGWVLFAIGILLFISALIWI